MWGTPLVVLLCGGGLYFMIYSRMTPYRYFGHAVNILRGKYDDPNDPGDINHFEALSSALAATIGLGNISGVAVAIAAGGPGAVFWMWMSALVGIATKFFTCTLSIMYRGKDSNGDIQGGTMYMITEGLGKKWKPLAVLFAVAGMFGALPVFQANQLNQAIRDVILVPNGIADPNNHFSTDLITGIVILLIVGTVIFGGIKRIGKVASRMVPSMVVLYVGCVLTILAIHFDVLGEYLLLIVTDAFTADAAMGGAVGALIILGVRRAAFSNEAGIGTATLAHGAAKTKEPVREGLVAMLGPFIDTIVVCTMTALAILVTDVWKTGDENGITLTASAFEEALGAPGIYLLMISVTVFAASSLFTYSYYGTKCLGFLAGASRQKWYNLFYVGSILLGATASISAIINLIDGMYAVMAIPTMTVALLLSPKVMEAARDYFSRMENKEIL
ncbi:MAG: alanine:cation symporter family protein [Balneolaceae bacterium]|nr:alanine:cation symporter family protein [Balneolaceae bacterium]MBO6545667.1 alanine:cation symporter family protein [Balneolaceae bacterium]MBO6647063.1 alanine:cation symporter family protein [Balneolaceae bacterium]